MQLKAQLSDFSIVCRIHAKEGVLMCLQVDCNEKDRILCTKCIIEKKHKDHKILDFDDAQNVINDLFEQSHKQLDQKFKSQFNVFKDLKQKLMQQLEELDCKILLQYCPNAYYIQECMKQRDLDTLMNVLMQEKQEKGNQEYFDLELDYIQLGLQEMCDKIDAINQYLSPTQVSQSEWAKAGIIQAHKDLIYAVSILGNRAATGGGDRFIGLWDIEKQKQIRYVEAHEGVVWSVLLTKENVISGSDDNTIKYWDYQLNLVKQIDTYDAVFSLALNEDFSQLASGLNNILTLWNDKKQGGIMQGHTDYITSLQYQGILIVSGSKDKTVKLWNSQKLELIKDFAGHTQTIRSVSISSDGKYLASGGYDKQVRVWNVQTKDYRSFDHGDIIWGVKFLGNEILSGGKDSRIKFWDYKKGNMNCSLDCQRTVMGFDVNNNQLIAAINRDLIIFHRN